MASNWQLLEQLVNGVMCVCVCLGLYLSVCLISFQFYAFPPGEVQRVNKRERKDEWQMTRSVDWDSFSLLAFFPSTYNQSQQFALYCCYGFLAVEIHSHVCCFSQRLIHFIWACYFELMCWILCTHECCMWSPAELVSLLSSKEMNSLKFLC